MRRRTLGRRRTHAYRIVEGGRPVELPGVQWADWASDGTLLVATGDGRLETRGAASWLEADVVVAELADDLPGPRAAPPEARRWP